MTGTELAKADDINERYAVRHTDKIVPFIPEGFASVLKFAELIAVSGMAPKGLEKADKVAVAIFHGMEVGFTPMAALQSIAVINGRPSVWGDGALAMVRASGLLEDIDETYDGGDLWLEPPTFDDFGKQTKAGKPNTQFRAVCTTTRKGAKRAIASEFSVLDAMTAGLWNKEGPWRTNPKRMLKMRARGFNLRDEFTDVMRGLVLAEEAQDYGTAIEHAAKEEPPEDTSGKTDVATTTRRRKPAEQANKYQGGDNDKVEDAEIIAETAAADKTKPVEQVSEQTEQTQSEDPPAEPAKPAAVKKKAEPKAADKPAEVKPAETKSPAATFMDALFAEMDADPEVKKLGTGPLKDYVKRINNLLAPFSDYNSMRDAWNGHERMANLTTAQQAYRDRMRNFHKDRIQAIGKSEDPPAEGGTKQEERVFDYAGFLHEVDVILGGLKSADEVNQTYATLTAGPIADGIITDQQVEDELRPLLAAHLERTDFGA